MDKETLDRYTITMHDFRKKMLRYNITDLFKHDYENLTRVVFPVQIFANV